MNIDEFFQHEVPRVAFECGHCRLYDVREIDDGPDWLLELQEALKSYNSRRHSLLQILEKADALNYVPVTIDDVQVQFECEVISGAGPWHGLAGALQNACAAAGVSPDVDLASLTPEKLEEVDRAFTEYPGYITRVASLGRGARAISSISRIHQALREWQAASGFL